MSNYPEAEGACWLKPTIKCVKTYQSVFKLYKITYYCLYQVCPCCGCEFECCGYYKCPYCGNSVNNGDDPPQPGFVLFPELLLPTSQLAVFPELAFYP